MVFGGVPVDWQWTCLFGARAAGRWKARKTSAPWGGRAFVCRFDVLRGLEAVLPRRCDECAVVIDAIVVAL